MKSGLDRLFATRNVVRAKAQICVKDAELRNIHYLHSGICVGYDLLADGRRQIISLYLPGDLIDAGAVNRRLAGQNVVAMSEAVVGMAGIAEIRAALAEDPRAYEVFVSEIVKRHAMLEVWVCTLGRKSAVERMATFFCEILTRMRLAGAGTEDGCNLPLNQIDLSDILGISVVHVNRVLKTLRETNLASFEAGRLEVHDFDRLAAIAEFDPAYLM
jgi:CRP-like cAMP-binding protein